jgi:hypothetical protein
MTTTPAPWALANTIPARRGPIEILSKHGLHIGTALTIDDARLIAAAPELLAAGIAVAQVMIDRMAWCCGMWDEGHEDDCPAQALRAAIAKAKGGAS